MARIIHERTYVTKNWRYSLPGGILTAIFVALSYGDSEPSLSLGAVFFAGIIVGFLSKRHYGSGKGVGVLTGLIGAVPFLWILVQMLTATSGLSGPAWFTAAGTIMTVFIAFWIGVFGFALSAFIGEVGARIGDAITKSNPQSPTPAEQ